MAGRFSVEAVFKAVDRMSRPIVKMQGAVTRFAARASLDLKSVDNTFMGIHGGLKKIAGATALAGVAVGAIAKNVIGAGMSFEQQITNVAAVSLMTRDQIADLEKEALRLGAVTKFSATEAAQGMELMAKAGFTNSQILQGIGGVLNAAAAEGADLAETAGHVSNVLKGMGLEATEATRVADVLALASARTNSSIGSLGESMANTASTARQFNIPLEQVVGSVALLQDVGLDASVAGSALNTMLTNLTKPTDAVKARMRELGVTFKDSKGNMLPLRDVFANMAKAAEKSGGNMKQVAFFADLVGLRGQKAAANLADLFKSGKVNRLFDELENASGSAEKMAAIRMDTLSGDLLVLEAAVDGVKISLFDMQSGPLRGVVQGVTQWVEANKELIVSGVTDFIADVVKNLPEIVKWGKRVAVTVGTFYALAAAVKVAKVTTDAYLLTAKTWGVVTRAIGASTQAIGLFDRGVADAGKGLGGLREGLNAGALSKQINGINGLMGKAGMLGLALGVGVAFGMWLDHTFKLSDKLADLLAQLTGINNELDKAGGRSTKRGMKDRDGAKHYADGTVVDSAGKIIARGTNVEGVRNGQVAQGIANMTNPGPVNAPLISEMEALRFSLARTDLAAPKGFDPTNPQTIQPFQVVSPQEQVARSISETTTTTTTAEVTIRDDTGKAAITKKPRKGAVGVKLRPTGAF